MRAPGKARPGKPTKERAQGAVGGSGANSPVKQEAVKPRPVKTQYSGPTQKQKL